LVWQKHFGSESKFEGISIIHEGGGDDGEWQDHGGECEDDNE
jgi:hypothetical protein